MWFKLGQVVMTCGISETIKNNKRFAENVALACIKYKNCDWGITCKEDAAMNDKAIVNGDRILAVYETCEGNIWIITEWDRSVTTILFPREY